MALEINQVGAALGDIAEAALHLQTAVERLNTVEIAPSASANKQSAAIAKIAAEMERCAVDFNETNVLIPIVSNLNEWARQLRAL